MGKKIIAVVSLFLVFIMIVISSNRKETSLSIYINEVSASNGSNFCDKDGDYVDWIELYNEGDKTVSLKGFGLSDRKEVPKRWVFPDVEIAPGAYLVVCASGKNCIKEDGELHANFKIDSAGESVYLSDAEGHLISSMNVEAVTFDKSYGCIRGTAECAELKIPTPGKENTEKTDTVLKGTEDILFSHPAGYYEQSISLELSFSENEAEIYYTLDGSVPDQTYIRMKKS